MQCVDALGVAFKFSQRYRARWRHLLFTNRHPSQVQTRCVMALSILLTGVLYQIGICVLYLGFVSHGSFAQHRDLGPSLFLKTFDCVALRSQDLPHEIELVTKQSRTKLV